jgi:acyl dehydratase
MSSHYFEDINVGDVFTTRRRTVTEADVVHFAGLSGDFTAIHIDKEHAKQSPFGERVAHGFLGVSIASGLLTQLGHLEETAIALLEFTCRFVSPIRLGDTIQVRQLTKDKRETSKPDRGIVTFDLTVLNQSGETVIAGEEKIMVRRRA